MKHWALASLLILLEAGGVLAVETVKWVPLPEVRSPRDNPLTSAKVALGRQLFFDKRLSRDHSLSCASCHDPAKGWSNAAPLATGIDQQPSRRHVPTLVNVAFQSSFFWDGRAGSLEEQALKPIENPAEMGMPVGDLVKKLNAITGYRTQFEKVFGTPATPKTIAKALAAYQRTIISRNAPVDRYFRGDKKALSPPAERGLKLFFGQARCHLCHAGPNFTDGSFHNIGIGLKSADGGREQITGKKSDHKAFKTPTLREIARTAPYMHDGSFATLKQVVQHYNFGGVSDQPNPHRDERLEVLYLGEDQVADLVTFLKEGLSSPDYPLHKAPTLPK
ncbi:MAG: cytochrome-c peroxidase [Gemmatales bacterium]|nr:MAG: cytochrome-c peroxidase [Gemmatales bacterium]